jgi:hypothetical protein
MPPTQARDESIRRRDDRLAILATLAGAGLAFVSRQVPLELIGSLALGLGGVLYSVRGNRHIDGYGWVRAAFAVTLIAVALHRGMELYFEFSTTQWLADDRPPGHDDWHRFERAAFALRAISLAGGLSFLLGAFANRSSAPARK